MKQPPRSGARNTPTERPLDDGARYGPETWREIDGVSFSHWDRWLLRVALDEQSGLDGVVRAFRARMGGSYARNDVAEAMLAQLADLKSRMARLGAAPASLLDEEERASEWLRKKAEKRVWHSGPNSRTAAMRNTPRRRLCARALRGHWPGFPVSPARFEGALQRVVGDGYYDYRTTGALATLLELEIDILARNASSAADRLALHRAAMTVMIEAMERVDDSMCDIGEAFRATECAYLLLARDALGVDAVLRDLLELAVWEDYGLIRGVHAFLGLLSEERADAAVRELAAIIAELRPERLEYQLARALELRRTVVAPWG